MASIWQRFTASISNVKQTLDDTKEAYYMKQREEWLAEVVDAEAGGRFRHFPAWSERYEPKAAAGGEEEPPSALQVRMLEYMSDQIRDNILQMLMEMVSKLLGPAEESLNAADADLGAFLNAANGIVLSYRFAHLDAEKFAYIRTYGADQVAVSLARAVARESDRVGQAAGAEPDAPLTPEQVQAVTAGVADRIVAEIRSKEREAHEALERNPLLAKASEQDERVDEGVQQLKAFLRGYVEQKTDTMVSVLRGVVERVLERVAASSAVIQAHGKARALAIAKHAEEAKEAAEAAAAAGDGAGKIPRTASTQSLIDGPSGPDPLQADPEFVQVREDILAEVEKAHGVLSEQVRHYVQGLVFMLSGVKPSEQEAALAQAANEAEAKKAEAAEKK